MDKVSAAKEQTRGLFGEFKEFAVKGSVIDLAVGIIIGGAFGKIVSSLVADVLMPLIGILFGGISLAEMAVTVGEAEVRYGAFVQSILDFLIVAWCIFLLVKAINRIRRMGKKDDTTVVKDK